MDPTLLWILGATAAVGVGLALIPALRHSLERLGPITVIAGFGFLLLALAVMGLLPMVQHRDASTVRDVRADVVTIDAFRAAFGEPSPEGLRVTWPGLLARAQPLVDAGLATRSGSRIELRSDALEQRADAHRADIRRLHRLAFDHLLSAMDREKILRDNGNDAAKAQAAVDALLDPVTDAGPTREQVRTALKNLAYLKGDTESAKRARDELPRLRELESRFDALDTNGDGRVFHQDGKPHSDAPPAVPAAALAEFDAFVAHFPGESVRTTRLADFEWRVIIDGRTFHFDDAKAQLGAERRIDARLGLAIADTDLDGRLDADELLALGGGRGTEGRLLLHALRRFDTDGDARWSARELADGLLALSADGVRLTDDDFERVGEAERRAAGALLDLGGWPTMGRVDLTALRATDPTLALVAARLDADGDGSLDESDALSAVSHRRRLADAVFRLTGSTTFRRISSDDMRLRFVELDRNGDGAVDAGDIDLPVPPYTFAEQRGRTVYIREGCVYCHSQFVRPVSGEERRWGPVAQRAEYLHDQPHLLGTRRIGPDLLRVGGKYSDGWHWAHHLRPRNVTPESIMPSFHFLFQHRYDDEYVARKARVDRFIETFDAPHGAALEESGSPAPARDGAVRRRYIDAATGRSHDDIEVSLRRIWSDARSRGEPKLSADGTEWVADIAGLLEALGIGQTGMPVPPQSGQTGMSVPLRLTASDEGRALAAVEARLRDEVLRRFRELDLNRDGVIDASDARRRVTREMTDLTAYLQRLGTAISLDDWRGTHFDVSTSPSVALDEADREAGAALFARHCIGCHGERGDGRGEAAEFLDGFEPESLGDDGKHRQRLGLPAQSAQPRPRDFTAGRFKFRTTPNGSPPADADLLRTVSRGLRGTAMPAFHELTDKDRRLLVAHVKRLSDRVSLVAPGRADGSANAGTGGVRAFILGSTVFDGEEFTVTFEGDDRWSIVGRLDGQVRHRAGATTGKPATVPELGLSLVPFGEGLKAGDAFGFTTHSVFHDPRRRIETMPEAAAPAPTATFALLRRGRELYMSSQAGCVRCHGPQGKGDGPAAAGDDFVNDWGYRAKPADFTDIYGLRSGATAADIRRTLVTGVGGTPMAHFAPVHDRDGWALAHYVLHLRRLGLQQRQRDRLAAPGVAPAPSRAVELFDDPP